MARTERKFLMIYILLAVTMFVCVTYLPHGHDMNFHVYRIGSIADNLRQNGIGGFPFIYYKGYTAKNKDTKKQYAVEKNSQGYLNVEIGNDIGDIVVYYRGTPLQKICNYISAVSAALLCLYVGIRHMAKTSPVFKSS